MHRLFSSITAVAVLACVDCGPPAAPQRQEPAKPSSRVEGLRSSSEVSAALQAAEKAYLAGSWGDAVVQSNRVMEGMATPDEYYAAVKILGLASCNRRDARPAAFALKRLQPEDRDHLRSVCEQNGVKLPDQ